MVAKCLRVKMGVFHNLGIGARKGSKQHRNGEGIPLLLTWEASS
jgi:hypothetical protein